MKMCITWILVALLALCGTALAEMDTLPGNICSGGIAATGAEDELYFSLNGLQRMDVDGALTTPYGRYVKTAGYPVRVCEMLATLDGVALAQRVTVDCVKNVRIAKKAIRKAFENQMAGRGYSIVEVLSTCPTNWGMTPQEALEGLREKMIPYYPLGVYKDVTEAQV